MAKFFTSPQRSDGKGFVDCDIHRATSWAVKKTWVNGGLRRYEVISRHATKTIADGAVLSHNLGRAGPKRNYKLGQRMAPKET